jgi:hypothetical protein
MKRRFACLSMVTLAAAVAQAGDNTTHRAIDPDAAYKNNCMRCHTSVQQYSPRMTKTIVMHMRIRANLPEDQAQAILEYLNGESEPVRPVAKRVAGNNDHPGAK